MSLPEPYRRYLCDCCCREFNIWKGKECDCYDHGVLEEWACPTCWEWRDHGAFEDSISACDNCRFQAKTMMRLGIMSPDETLLDTYHETVRMRNCVLTTGTPVSRIELRKGKIIGRIQSRLQEPVIWDEGMKEWQAVDDFVINRLSLPTII